MSATVSSVPFLPAKRCVDLSHNPSDRHLLHVEEVEVAWSCIESQILLHNEEPQRDECAWVVVSGNVVEDRAAQFIASSILIPLSRHCSTLSLDCCFCGVSSHGVEALVEAAASFSTALIHLGYCGLGDGEALAIRNGLDNGSAKADLFHEEFLDCDQTKLPACGRVHLWAPGNLFGCAGIKALLEATGVVSLDVSQCLSPDAEQQDPQLIRVLSGLLLTHPTLEKLHLADAYGQAISAPSFQTLRTVAASNVNSAKGIDISTSLLKWPYASLASAEELGAASPKACMPRRVDEDAASPATFRRVLAENAELRQRVSMLEKEQQTVRPLRSAVHHKKKRKVASADAQKTNKAKKVEDKEGENHQPSWKQPLVATRRSKATAPGVPLKSRNLFASNVVELRRLIVQSSAIVNNNNSNGKCRATTLKPPVTCKAMIVANNAPTSCGGRPSDACRHSFFSCCVSFLALS